MWVFTQGYNLYPGHIKMIFISLFASQLLANYVVVQRWILPRDIIEEVPSSTVTSCVMKCSGIPKCTAVGFQNDPDHSKNDKCLLVKLLRKKNKNGTRIKIFALVDEHTALKDEKKERLSLAKQQSCPVDVNGGYGDWSNFTLCSKSCGPGLQFRNRSCDHPAPKFGGRNCSILGNATEMRSCNQKPCPIDGMWSAWNNWGTCSEACKSTTSRTRTCTNPSPTNGGKICSGTDQEEKSCNDKPCAINGGFAKCKTITLPNCKHLLPMQDCLAFQKAGYDVSGLYLNHLNNAKSVEVLCDQQTDNGGWTVIQRRIDGKENFYRDWKAYKQGFGDAQREYWLGNDNIHLLTLQASEIRFDMGDWDGKAVYAKYTTFSIENEQQKYRLTVNGFQGTVGDGLAYHNGQLFSTYDVDNDEYSKSCAVRDNGAWWYKHCTKVNLNSVYRKAGESDDNYKRLSWSPYKNKDYVMKYSEMKVRMK